MILANFLQKQDFLVLHMFRMDLTGELTLSCNPSYCTWEARTVGWHGMKSNGLYIPPRGKDYLAVLGHPLHGKCVNRGD